MTQRLFNELDITINKNPMDNYDVFLDDTTGNLYGGILTNENPSVGNITINYLHVNCIRFSVNMHTFEVYFFADGITYKDQYFNGQLFI